MGSIHEVGARGERLLAEYLAARGRTVQRSDRKTFDLIVDGRYAEVKTSDAPYSKLGFIGLTDAQYKALRDGTAFNVFVVCNAKNAEQLEVLEFDAVELLREEPKVECTYYWYRKHLDKCRSGGLDFTEAPPKMARVMNAPVDGGAPPIAIGERLNIHVRRLAATDDAALYIRLDRVDLSRLRLDDHRAVRLKLENGLEIPGVVRTTGGSTWLAPRPGSSNAAISKMLIAAGLRHGSDTTAGVTGDR